MFRRWIIFPFVLCIAMFSSKARAQGGLVGADTGVRYTPVAFPQLVQLSNFGSINISLNGSNGNGDALTFVLVSGPSQGSLGPLNSTKGTITYTPPPGFSTSDSFTFVVTDGVLSSEATTVTILAPQPSANLSVATLDMGDTLTGTKSPTKPVTISNPSVAPLNISSITVAGPNAGDFALENTGTCPANGSLAASTKCTLVVSFTPQATGARTAILAIADTAFDSPQSVALTGTGTDFSFAAVGGTNSATVSAGQPATYNLQISGSNGFVGLVSLTCAGAPLHSTCSTNPSQINVAGTPMNFAVTVATTATTTAQMVKPQPFLAQVSAICVFLALALMARFVFFGRFDKRWKLVCTGSALGCALLLAGCGGGGNNTPPPIVQQGTPAGTYTLTVTGATNGAMRSAKLTLIVQ
jgi:hypothetical protein